MAKETRDDGGGQQLHIKDLTPDPANAREHTARNVGVITDALQEVGAGRSIVVDEDNVILAGNATVEAAAQAGLYKVRVVEADGHEIIAVRRRGLTAEQKARLALYDNRAGELSRWNEAALAGLAERGLTRGLFTPEELAVIAQGIAPGVRDEEAPPAAFPGVDENLPTSFQCPRCRYEWSGSPRPADGGDDVGLDAYGALKGGHGAETAEADAAAEAAADGDLAGEQEL